MSLLQLFLPHPAHNQGAFTVAAIQQIQTVRPTLIFVQKREGEFTELSETYNG